MLTKDIYNKPLSNSFISATTAYSQSVKPKIIIDLLDSRHLSNVSYTTNMAHSSNSKGDLGYYFSESEAYNGFTRQSFTWAVTDSKDKTGNIIKADGSWYAMPSKNDDGFEFGWWTPVVSQSNGLFATPPVLTMDFDERKINKLRIYTSEFNGQVEDVRVKIYNSSIGEIYNEKLTFNSDEYFKEIDVNTSAAIAAQHMAYRIELTIISTKNGQDFGRIQEISPLYQVDITDYVKDFSVSRTRDVHESSLPIAGAQSSKLSLSLDNTTKDWNVFNSSSLYGQYLKKDLKISVSTGWRIKKTNEIMLSTTLTSAMNTSSSTISVINTDIFPEGGVDNYFIVTIDPENENREIILCSAKANTYDLTVESRGYFTTDPKSHSVGATVQFEPYEFVPMGDYYVDEWNISSSSMTASLTASDWTKFLAEKNITKGFLLQNSTVGDVVKNLIMRANFPQTDYKQIEPYTKETSKKGGIAQYSFNESIVDRSGNSLILSDGLRVRFWAMRTGNEYLVKDIVGDALEKELANIDKALGVKPFVSPDFTAISKNISGSITDGLNLVDYEFQGNDGEFYSEYYNGIADGYYIPLEDGNKDISVTITNGGARIYIDDTLVASDWKDNSAETVISSYSYLGDWLNLHAGIPYKIRIEFFHTTNDPVNDFNIAFYSETEGDLKTLVAANELKTMVAKDSLGARNAPFLTTEDNFNHHNNDGIYIGQIEVNKDTGLISDETNKSVYLTNGGYIRIPNHSSIAIGDHDFSYEIYAKFNNSSFNNGGEYLSSFSSDIPSNGFEFYYSGASVHGFKFVTSAGVINVGVTSGYPISTTNFTHIAVTYNSSTDTAKYFVNGILARTLTSSGTVATQTQDICIGGRNASFTPGIGEIAPTNIRSFYIDEFAIYNTCLSDDDIRNRYISTQVQPITVHPFLYGNDQTLREAVDNITFADLGRFYIDEENKGRYEHFYRFFEPSISQHAIVQHEFSDDENIIDAEVLVNLQVNKVVVKITKTASFLNGTQPLWRPDDPTTLGVIKLTSNITASSNTITVSSTTEPPFANVGYLVIDNEIVQYSGKTDNQFLGVERGMYDTVATSHTVNTKVREVRVYNVQYDKAPAFSIKNPFIAGIEFEKPALVDILRFEPSPYIAELIVSASTNVDAGTFVYLEGKNPLTEQQYYASIAGIPVVVAENNSQIEEKIERIEDNIRKYGVKEITIDGPYITDINQGKKLAKFIINKMNNPVPIITVNIMGTPTIQLGDRVRISSLNSFDIINADYWVISQEFSYGSSINQTLTLRQVT